MVCGMSCGVMPCTCRQHGCMPHPAGVAQPCGLAGLSVAFVKSAALCIQTCRQHHSSLYVCHNNMQVCAAGRGWMSAHLLLAADATDSFVTSVSGRWLACCGSQQGFGSLQDSGG